MLTFCNKKYLCVQRSQIMPHKVSQSSFKYPSTYLHISRHCNSVWNIHQCIQFLVSYYGYYFMLCNTSSDWTKLLTMSARMGASRALAKNRQKELLKKGAGARRQSDFAISSGHTRIRSSNSWSKGILIVYYNMLLR